MEDRIFCTKSFGRRTSNILHLHLNMRLGQLYSIFTTYLQNHAETIHYNCLNRGLAVVSMENIGYSCLDASREKTWVEQPVHPVHVFEHLQVLWLRKKHTLLLLPLLEFSHPLFAQPWIKQVRDCSDLGSVAYTDVSCAQLTLKTMAPPDPSPIRLSCLVAYAHIHQWDAGSHLWDLLHPKFSN